MALDWLPGRSPLAAGGCSALSVAEVANLARHPFIAGAGANLAALRETIERVRERAAR